MFYRFIASVNEVFSLQSSSLADGICSSRYYSLDKEMQRNLLFIITRSQKPKRIVAGGFFKLDMAFSTSVRGAGRQNSI